ncbi:MAG TPA: hypothetical protein DCR14_12360, partial [Acidimicrobiaceae bacterium]|nr:hypothetical protein [Acidimicrobiaceae bacterium]
WLGLALLVEGVALVAAAVRARDPWNVVLHAVAVAAFGGAWAAFAVGQTGWSYETRWAITAVAAGGCLVICGAVVRARPPWRWWVGAWAALGGIGVAFASFASAGMADPEMLQQWLVLSMLLAAGGAALAATVVPGMRWATIALGACSALWANVGFDPTPAVGVAVSAGIGGLAIASALVRWAQRDDAEWVLPLLALGALAGGAAFFEALEPLPSRGLLVVVLALLAMEFAAVGLTCGWLSCVMVAPVTLVAAWLTYASGAALGDPQWYTVPVGVCVLVDVALVRRLAPNRWRYQLRQALALADVVGMALVVGAALVAAVQGKHWSAALAVLGGTLLATWGAITKVRRRAWFGAATVLVGVTLLLGVPLVRFMRTHEELWSGGAIWLWVAAGGLVAILTATFLEQGRVRVHQAVQKLRDLTSDWE